MPDTWFLPRSLISTRGAVLKTQHCVRIMTSLLSLPYRCQILDSHHRVLFLHLKTQHCDRIMTNPLSLPNRCQILDSHQSLISTGWAVLKTQHCDRIMTNLLSLPYRCQAAQPRGAVLFSAWRPESQQSHGGGGEVAELPETAGGPLQLTAQTRGQ